MSKRKPAGYWTLERCMEESAQYESRSAWKKNSNSSYCRALDSGWLDQCCGHMTGGRKPDGYWSLERCMEDAKQYKTRKEWQTKSPTGYSRAGTKGFRDKCCAHMDFMTGRAGRLWNLERCMEDAKQYSFRHEWEIASPGYQAARRNGWLKDCVEHMSYSQRATDGDVIYLWEDTTSGLYKIGVTSARIGDKRIQVCVRRNSMNALIRFMVKVPDAYAVESELLKLGTDPELDSSIDGYTEFRKLTNTELGQAVSIAYEAALSAA